jgi:hypothetical protein
MSIVTHDRHRYATPPPAVYRCIYCGAVLKARDLVPHHEATCDDRFVHRYFWQKAIEKALRREVAAKS